MCWHDVLRSRVCSVTMFFVATRAFLRFPGTVWYSQDFFKYTYNSLTIALPPKNDLYSKCLQTIIIEFVTANPPLLICYQCNT